MRIFFAVVRGKSYIAIMAQREHYVEDQNDQKNGARREFLTDDR